MEINREIGGIREIRKSIRTPFSRRGNRGNPPLHYSITPSLHHPYTLK